MKAAELITAQLHRNPHLIETPLHATIRAESRKPRRRGLRRRRP